MTKRNDCEVIRPLLNHFNNTHLLWTSVIIADNQAMEMNIFRVRFMKRMANKCFMTGKLHAI